MAADGSAVVAFAAPGDLDLDGVVGVFDLVAFDAAGRYGTGAAAGWSADDVNYDGVANLFDLVAIDGAGVFRAGNYLPTGSSAMDVEAVAVPEPGWLPLVVTAVAAGLLVRRA